MYIYIHVYLHIYIHNMTKHIYLYTYTYIHIYIPATFLGCKCNGTHIRGSSRLNINQRPCFKGGPEPLENEINKILGSKREDRFSDHFSDLVQNICSVRFPYLLCLSMFCKAPRDMRKFPQKCQKIAGC